MSGDPKVPSDKPQPPGTKPDVGPHRPKEPDGNEQKESLSTLQKTGIWIGIVIGVLTILFALYDYIDADRGFIKVGNTLINRPIFTVSHGASDTAGIVLVRSFPATSGNSHKGLSIISINITNKRKRTVRIKRIVLEYPASLKGFQIISSNPVCASWADSDYAIENIYIRRDIDVPVFMGGNPQKSREKVDLIGCLFVRKVRLPIEVAPNQSETIARFFIAVLKGGVHHESGTLHISNGSQEFYDHHERIAKARSNRIRGAIFKFKMDYSMRRLLFQVDRTVCGWLEKMAC